MGKKSIFKQKFDLIDRLCQQLLITDHDIGYCLFHYLDVFIDSKSDRSVAF